MSVGLVYIVARFSGFCFKNESTPETINKAKSEKIIKFNKKWNVPAKRKGV